MLWIWWQLALHRLHGQSYLLLEHRWSRFARQRRSQVFVELDVAELFVHDGEQLLRRECRIHA